ncbi:MAG: hypothetical protein A2X94_10640 [Bdellovibrionales bacterium GWB1_55_8]|nr:MAG: hypothetical protein A2X94_10640 [Bdellovibrionales bacterium GWB1_55_8]
MNPSAVLVITWPPPGALTVRVPRGAVRVKSAVRVTLFPAMFIAQPVSEKLSVTVPFKVFTSPMVQSSKVRVRVLSEQLLRSAVEKQAPPD